MKQYRCVKECMYPLLGRRRWKVDMLVDVSDDVNLPYYFELVSEDKRQVIKADKDESNTFSGIQKQQKKLSRVKSGFASNLDKIEPDEPLLKKKR